MNAPTSTARPRRHADVAELMDEPPPHIRSFVVKVWAEEAENPLCDDSWRGYVTHVESGKRLYLRSLTQLPRFIAPHVVDIGGRLDLRTRLCAVLAPRPSEP